MGIIKMIKDTKRAFMDASAPDPEPRERRMPTDEEIRRRIYLLNECVTVEGFIHYSEKIDRLPGDSAVATVEMNDEGCFVLIGGERYGYLWDPKPEEIGLRDGQRVVVEVSHTDGDPDDHAQLFIPKVR